MKGLELFLQNFDEAYNFEQALEFDGVDQYGTLPFTFSSTIATISAWVKTNEVNNCRFLGNSLSLTEWVDIRPSTNIVNLRRSAGGVNFNFPSVNTEVWQHIYIHDNLGSCRVFLSGVESTSGAQAVGGNFTFDLLMFTGTTVYFQGILDDVMLTNTIAADPAATAAAIYNNGDGADPLTFFPSAQQLYRFNNNSNNDGALGGSATLVNSPTYVTH